MLNSNKLQNELQKSIHNIIVPAIERMELKRMPTSSKMGNKLAKDIAKTFDELVSKQLAKIIANAIDSYIKNANITGTIVTNGSPTTQVGTFIPASKPLLGGKLPNTLGIN